MSGIIAPPASAADRPTTSGDAATQAPGDRYEDLPALVEDYFHTVDTEARSKLVAAIEEASGGDVAAVARTMRDAVLWEPLPTASGVVSFESPVEGVVPVAYRVGEGYDPARASPAVCCMTRSGLDAEAVIDAAKEALGAAARDFAFFCPTKPVCRGFHQPVESAGDVARMLRAVLKEVHTDTDRVFVFGFDLGGEAAWQAALARPDLFSGAIILAAYPHVPYPEQTYPILLPNLGELPVLTVWRSPDGSGMTPHARAVAAHNQAIVAFAKRAALPIVGVEVAPMESAGLKPPEAAVQTMLARRRAARSPNVAHWFRYPAHGRTDWLSQVKFMGDIWQADQLAIAAAPTADRDGFIGDVIKAKLGYLAGRIEGQQITIETRRCARVELLLPAELVDLTKPILVQCNGRRRYDKTLAPSVKVLLETAYESWDLQRPVAARLSFSVRTDAPLD
jgi:pimeloyl-ACP methyl ester carboxylesterase